MIAPLCRRTWCIWHPGEELPGFRCTYAWSGAIPCTGSLRCLYCGSYKLMESTDAS